MTYKRKSLSIVDAMKFKKSRKSKEILFFIIITCSENVVRMKWNNLVINLIVWTMKRHVSGKSHHHHQQIYGKDFKRSCR